MKDMSTVYLSDLSEGFTGPDSEAAEIVGYFFDGWKMPKAPRMAVLDLAKRKMKIPTALIKRSVETAAQGYAKEHGGRGANWREMFPPETLKAAMRQLRTAIKERMAEGSFKEDVEEHVAGIPMSMLAESAMGLEERAGYGRRMTEAKKLSKRALDAEIQRLYSKWFDRVEVNIMALSKIRNAIKQAIVNGEDLSKVMPALVKKYREN